MSYEIKTEDFSLRQTLECGQCFRFRPVRGSKGSDRDSRYFLQARDKAVVAEQKGERFILHCSEAALKWWIEYFDLDRDYGAIKKTLSDMDGHLGAACADKWGIHLLKQDPFEMLITFILSQNKQIPHIKKLVESIAESYGERLTYRTMLDGENFETAYHAFPSAEAMTGASEEALRALKVGFRAPYIVDAVKKSLETPGILDGGGSLAEKRKGLMTIKGVGRKVADCVMLFGMGEYGAFPVDVWVGRVMRHYYGEPVDGESRFGSLAGFAQQYLFYHARDGKMGKIQKT